jgi:hypothetical protein
VAALLFTLRANQGEFAEAELLVDKKVVSTTLIGAYDMEVGGCSLALGVGWWLRSDRIGHSECPPSQSDGDQAVYRVADRGCLPDQTGFFADLLDPIIEMPAHNGGLLPKEQQPLGESVRVFLSHLYPPVFSRPILGCPRG